MRSAVPVPADQHWFWTERWQQMERAAGAASDSEGPESFKADYRRLGASGKERFKEASVEFSVACDPWLLDPGTALPVVTCAARFSRRLARWVRTREARDTSVDSQGVVPAQAGEAGEVGIG